MMSRGIRKGRVKLFVKGTADLQALERAVQAAYEAALREFSYGHRPVPDAQ